jgi:pyrimidine operon attenuation protein/uracil phosphoribosyltransferase
MSQLILTPSAVEAKLRRIACRIVEDHYEMGKVVLVGVGRHGTTLGRRIFYHAESFVPGKVIFFDDIRLAYRPDAAYVVADGVLFTGETMRKSMAVMDDFNPVSVKMAVLVDRGHAKWPVRADYVGLHLATTLREYVRIEEKSHEYCVFLD